MGCDSFRIGQDFFLGSYNLDNLCSGRLGYDPDKLHLAGRGKGRLGLIQEVEAPDGVPSLEIGEQ